MWRTNPILFLLSVALILVGVGIVILLIWWLICKSTRLEVTNKRTIVTKGLLSKATNEVRHSDVRNIQVTQSFLQRILGCGTIAISSAGQSEMEILVTGIPDPQGIAETIRENQD
jgi:uncharacterized membrane protein YdbT with pleckstrin-like domain